MKPINEDLSNYEPYGPGIGESGSEEFRYTGKQEDPTGLYYYGARYYDPVTGRFTTRDSVFGDLTDPQSLNRYVYCRNNPHKYTDPDGRFWNIIIGAGVGAIIGGGWYLVTHLDTLHTAETQREILVQAASGAVSGAVMSMGGPVLGVAGKIALRGAASILSYSTEVLTRSALGLSNEYQEPAEIATEVVTSVVISSVVSAGLKKIPKLDKTVITTLENSGMSKQVSVIEWKGTIPQTRSIGYIVGTLTLPRITMKMVTYAMQTDRDRWSQYTEPSSYSYNTSGSNQLYD